MLVAVATLLMAITPAHACDCVGSTVEERVDRSQLVLIADVISLTEPGAIVQVEHYLKGSGEAVIEVGGRRALGLCGFFDDASIGETCLLFGFESRPESGAPLGTSLCSGNAQLTGDFAGDIAAQRIAEVEAVTGPGQPPDNALPIAPAEDDDFPREAFWAAAILLPVAFLATATFTPWRRR